MHCLAVPSGSVTPEELAAAGVYDPGAPDAADRLAAVQLLVERGATIDDLRDAAGDLGGLAARLVLRPGGQRLTQRELAARAGVPVELVERVWLTAGIPNLGP